MHQQVRTTTIKSGSSSDGPGAQADPGGLFDILETVKDLNLQTAGGHDLDDGGEFVFSVHHKHGEEGQADEAERRLIDKGYDAKIVEVFHCDVDDRPGALLRCIRDAVRKNGPVHEIFVGTPESDKKIPVQVISRGRADKGAAAR